MYIQSCRMGGAHAPRICTFKAAEWAFYQSDFPTIHVVAVAVAVVVAVAVAAAVAVAVAVAVAESLL